MATETDYKSDKKEVEKLLDDFVARFGNRFGSIANKTSLKLLLANWLLDHDFKLPERDE